MEQLVLLVHLRLLLNKHSAVSNLGFCRLSHSVAEALLQVRYAPRLMKEELACVIY